MSAKNLDPLCPRAVLVALCAIAACSEPQSRFDPQALGEQLGTFTVHPIESGGVDIAVHDVNASGVVVGYFIAGSTGTAFRWHDATFTPLPFNTLSRSGSFGSLPLDRSQTIGLNDAGDVVGAIDDVPWILPAGSTTPVRMFREDTTIFAARPMDVNNHGEALIRTMTSLNAGEGIVIWKGGFHTWFSAICSPPIGINEQGVVIRNPGCSPSSRWERLRSPYNDAPLVESGKLGGLTCDGGGRTAIAIAENDSNEVLGAEEQLQTEDNRHDTIWWAAGCRNLSEAYPQLTLRALNNRAVVAGSRVSTTDTSAVVARLPFWTTVDALLATPEWHIVDVLRILDSNLMLASGYRLADRKLVAVLLVPDR